MFLIELKDGNAVGHPITLDNFKQCNLEMSLPFPLLPEHIEPHGYGIYDFAMKPEHGTFEVVEEVAPQRGENGVFYQTWAVRPMNDDERYIRTKEEWGTVRAMRNRKLYESDWTQLSDAPLINEQTAAWAIYRQALRDITTQSDPFNITWPQEPE